VPKRTFLIKLLIPKEDIRKLNYEGRRKVPICVIVEDRLRGLKEAGNKEAGQRFTFKLQEGKQVTNRLGAKE